MHTYELARSLLDAYEVLTIVQYRPKGELGLVDS